MMPNKYPSPYGRRPYGQPQYPPRKPRVQEDTLKSGEMNAERKSFVFLLRDNPRGRLLRIIEHSSGNRPPVSVIVPATGLKDFQKALAEMVKANEALPPTNGSDLNPPTT